MRVLMILPFLVVSSQLHAATEGQFDLLCDHTISVNTAGEKVEMRDPNPKMNMHYSVDLGEKQWCLRRADGTCGEVAKLTATPEKDSTIREVSLSGPLLKSA